MIALDPRRVPVGAAIGQGLFAIMEIVFHLGAHRTGSTTFQSYMYDNIRVLEDGGIAYWGPKTTRKGLFRGLIPTDPANEGQTATQERAEARVARDVLGLDDDQATVKARDEYIDDRVGHRACGTPNDTCNYTSKHHGI